MTSAPTILATCKQTRFHLMDENPSAEVDPLTYYYKTGPSNLDELE